MSDPVRSEAQTAPSPPAEGASSAPLRPVHRGPVWTHHALLLLFTFIWGGNFILAEVALRDMTPLTFSVSRFAVGGAALVTLLYLHCRHIGRRYQTPIPLIPTLEPGEWPRLIFVSLLGATFAPWLGIEGLALTDGARASLWLAVGPMVSTAIGWMLRTERLGPIGFAGVVLVCIGTFVLALDGLNPARNYWLGDLLLVAALLLAVTELHLIKPLASKYGAISMTASRTVIGGACYLLIASPGLVQVEWTGLGVWTWVAILFGGAVGVGVGQWLKVRALDALGPTRVVFYGNLVPIAAFAIAWVALSDRPSTLEWIAAALILVGALLLQVLDVRHHTTVAPDSSSAI